MTFSIAPTLARMPYCILAPSSAGPAAEPHQIDAIVEDLMDAGFDPIVDEDELTIDLTPCAHAAAQAEHRELLCRVHLGLMQGVLDAAGGPLSVDGMRSSCDPEQCVVQLMLAERATKVASDQPAA